MRAIITVMAEATDDYSTHGHAGLMVRANAPRFSDNPMPGPAELDELDASGGAIQATLDRLHDMFSKGGITDQELKQGVQLTDQGLHKAAAALGSSPDEVKMLIASLTQRLRDAEADNLEESYRRFMEAGQPRAPGDPDDADRDDADRDGVSAEGDYLGGVTVRSADTGKSRFMRGSQAATLKNKLASANAGQKQKLLRPLVEVDDDAPGPAGGFAAEIAKDAGGTYNFPWKLAGRQGFGTAAFNGAGGKRALGLISVRDRKGVDVTMDDAMRRQVLAQAKAFIADA